MKSFAVIIYLVFRMVLDIKGMLLISVCFPID